MEPYKGTLVLDFWEVVLLKDVVEEPDDFYWVYHNRRRGNYYGSCVGGWVPLKGFIPDEEYNRMMIVWNYNHDAENHAI